MTTLQIDGREYRLRDGLNDFQQEMYVHLIDWKWAHITRKPGFYHDRPYDAILPEAYVGECPMLYPNIVPAFRSHLDRFPFRLHPHFNHMASSQAANLNLFLPLILHPNANSILHALKPDIARLALSELDHGYRIEYWDEPFGNLADHTRASGTDADIAIAYHNRQDELCLWLIEHKLTESEFTSCGGFKSKGRRVRHDCSKPFSEILEDKYVCYYHDVNRYNYWNITEANRSFFVNHALYPHCPFQGGLNQLWRNQLLGLSIEQDERQPYRHVTFSVVKHPGNTFLDQSLGAYQKLVAGNPRFSVFTHADVLAAAAAHKDAALEQWIAWFRNLYNLQG